MLNRITTNAMTNPTKNNPFNTIRQLLIKASIYFKLYEPKQKTTNFQYFMQNNNNNHGQAVVVIKFCRIYNKE